MTGSERVRRRIEKALNQAYGDGLLSEHTHARRLDSLLRDPILEPDALIGDLAIRRTRHDRRAPARFQDTLGRGLRALRRPPAPGPDLPLLALDWTGATSELLLGRGCHCDIRLADISVSRRHAHLRFRDGGWILRDLGSTNGTTVNGTSVVRCRLLPGDEVVFGDSGLLID